MLQIIAMNSTTSSIKLPGSKIATLTVTHKGMTMPVNVYLVIPNTDEPFSLCVCFEDTPIETRLEIDKNKHGEWVDLYEGPSELARAIGAEIEKKIKPVLYN